MDELKKDLTHYLDKVEWLGDQKFGKICNTGNGPRPSEEKKGN